MKTAHEYQAAFQQSHPEAGSLTDGTYLALAEVHQFSAIISTKVAALSRKLELGSAEKSFISRAMVLGARSVEYVSNRDYVPIPADTDAARQVAIGVGHLRGSQKPAPADSMEALLGGVASGSYSIQAEPHLRIPIEETAQGVMRLFSEMAQAAPNGLLLDGYLKENLQNIAADFERVEQSR